MHSFKCTYTVYDGIYFSSYIISEGSSQLPEAETRGVLAKSKSSFFLFFCLVERYGLANLLPLAISSLFQLALYHWQKHLFKTPPNVQLLVILGRG